MMFVRVGTLTVLRVLLIVVLYLIQPATPLVANFHAVFSADKGFGGDVPTTWEVLHGMGLGGKTQVSLEGLHVSPPDAIVFLIVVDHNAWHKWYEWIVKAPAGSPTRWQRSMLVCNAPSKIRLPLENNVTTKHLDFTKDYVQGMNGDITPTDIDFFGYGRYAVLLVSCRGNDNATQRIDVSGRVEMVTETPSQIPALFNRPLAVGSNLSHLGYGESVYPFLWSVLLSFYVLLFIHWSHVLCRQRHLLWRRSRVVDPRLLVVALTSLACKIAEAALKLSHYDRLSQGMVYWSSLPFASSVMEAASSSLLLMFLALGALGITIVRINVYMREAVVLSIVLSLHFITGLSQAFCRENASPTAAVPPSSSSSISYMVGDVSKRDLDQYYINSGSCEVLVFSEYVVQALVMLAIIIALNYNIAKLRQHITGVTWGRLSHHLYDKLECFYIFRKIFMLYLLAPTLLLVIQIMILTWRYNWLMALMVEGANMIIFYDIGVAVFATGVNPFGNIPSILHQHDEQQIQMSQQQRQQRREMDESGAESTVTSRSNDTVARSGSNGRGRRVGEAKVSGGGSGGGEEIGEGKSRVVEIDNDDGGGGDDDGDDDDVLEIDMDWL
jgi:hypothetical protein